MQRSKVYFIPTSSCQSVCSSRNCGSCIIQADANLVAIAGRCNREVYLYTTMQLAVDAKEQTYIMWLLWVKQHGVQQQRLSRHDSISPSGSHECTRFVNAAHITCGRNTAAGGKRCRLKRSNIQLAPDSRALAALDARPPQPTGLPLVRQQMFGQNHSTPNSFVS